MSGIIQPFEPGTLQAKVQARTAHAMCRGAIHTIPTRFELVEHAGVNFLIRIVSNLARKVQANSDQRYPSKAANMDQDPFLPYDQDLFVADISDTHVCLLNKFNVLDHHILMVTRSFQEQESFLTLSDIQAVLLCLTEFEGLAFYNAGEAAGASQRHKHLQMVPLPLTAEVSHLPIEPLLETARFGGRIGRALGLHFSHVLVRMNPEWIASPLKGAQELLRQYLHMLQTLGLADGGTGEETRSPRPYNLLITRQWMLLVPRSTECFESISVNALGFAGGFLVKNQAQFDRLKTCGPMTTLRHVALC
ncbi:ATP adenylyltransferase family protein [Nitrospira sp. T9]|uniref:ATP adenylyltransferase family protein n=1 Tax=unclassified Nitrospira TaxID=2652172 RepID=UPI003F986F41